MLHKIVSLRKPIKVRILETGVKGEYELYIQHETGVENLSGLSVRDMVVLYQTIDCFLDDGAGEVGLTDDEQPAIMDEEDGKVSDLLVDTIIDGVSELLPLGAYSTVSKALHEYVVRTGMLKGMAIRMVPERWMIVRDDLKLLNPNLSDRGAVEYGQLLSTTKDNSLALAVLRNALNHEDEE